MKPDFQNQNSITDSISWSLAGQLSKRGLYVLFAIWLANILGPESFGLVAMAGSFIGLASVFSDMGLSMALIQDQKSGEQQYQSVFVINLLLGILLTILVAVTSPLIAAFYGDDRLLPLTLLLSLTFILGAPNFIQLTILRKALEFRVIAIAETIATLLSGVVAIFLAYQGAGVYAIVIQTLLYKVLFNLVLWHYSHWRPTFSFKRGGLKKMFQFSAYNMGTEVMEFIAKNIDNILIGRFIGSAALGMYDYAYKVMLSPNIFISSAISSVLFPTFSRMQEDKVVIKKMFLKAQRILVLFNVPAMLGLMVLAEVFIRSILGEAWLGMKTVLQIMAFVGAQKTIGALLNNLYLSMGRTDLSFKYGAIFRLLLIGSILAGLPWGIEGVALSYAIARTIVMIPNTVIACRLVGITGAEVTGNVVGIFVVAGLMAIAVFTVKTNLLAGMLPWLQLLAGTFTGICIYTLLLHFFNIKAYLELKILINEMLKKTNFIKKNQK